MKIPPSKYHHPGGILKIPPPKYHHPGGILLQNKITVHSPLFFRKMVEIERFALRAAILHELLSKLLRGRGRFGSGSEKNRAIIPDARPFGTFKNQDGRH